MNKLDYLIDKLEVLTEKYYQIAEEKLNSGSAVLSDIYFDVAEDLENLLNKVEN
jgi:hypothetical protein